jgi:hypothetical protein
MYDKQAKSADGFLWRMQFHADGMDCARCNVLIQILINQLLPLDLTET